MKEMIPKDGKKSVFKKKKQWKSRRMKQRDLKERMKK